MLQRLAELKEQLLDGTMKDKMVESWLTLIETKTAAYLAHLGYDEHAVPADYISQPPQNIALVRKNYRIIQAILDKTDVHNVRSLVVSGFQIIVVE